MHTFRVVLQTRDCGTVNMDLLPATFATKVGVTSNNGDIAALLCGAWLALLCDSPLPSDKSRKPLAVFHKLLRSWENETLYGVIARFSDLADRLAKEAWRVILPSGEPGTITGDLFQQFRDTPVFKEYCEWKKSEDPELYRYLHTFLRFGKKCEFSDPEFNQRALRSWYGVEERLSDHSFEGNEHIPTMARILRLILPPKFCAPVLMGKHGSGRVAGPEVGEFEKSSNFRMYPSLDRLFSQVFPLGGASEGVMLGYCSNFISATSPNSRDEGTSHLSFARKNYKVSRTICAEPPEYMYFQQHMRWELEHAIRTGVLGHHVKINDQGFNQSGALYGSKTGDVDTIDLSSASDSVHVDLVKAVFPRPWLDGLLETRTSLVGMPDGKVVRVTKFAPMGSAVCFPVQCLIYATVCIHAYIRHFSDPSDVDSILSTRQALSAWLSRLVSSSFDGSSSAETFAVYGDDIICDTRVTGDIMSILEELGFVINDDKSFVGTHLFRESCGVYAYNGNDVTPLLFKGKAFQGPWGPKVFARYIELANMAGDYGYMRLHSYMVNAILRWRPPDDRETNPIAFSSLRNQTFAIYSATPRNSHLEVRDGGDLQRCEARSYILMPASAKDPAKWPLEESFSYEAYSLGMDYRAAFLRGGDDYFVTPRRVLLGAKIAWGWTPT